MKDNSVFLNYILDAINQIEEYTEYLTYEEFLEKRLIQDAVIRQLEIIGEATKNISPSTTENYPLIPWKEIAGMRDKLIHVYFGVDLDEVWNTTKRDIPELKTVIETILAN
ncbi:Uncharacterized conserved protein, contains HEPN domain [Methanolobus vulcani]|uniref:Uncharacterized conserved protein, contains HEPN domain n=1 Tax=Methanolobus vulcani TaxID=38026 RepID=A0A7Z7AVT0_9EURY|nr:DUF86 domain-containing protein [Methanolobus vulcani]MDK2824956.1 hypothetical protein [Methanolobus sp.]SDF34951.1 Uncharacterized conserved protein, contains HEPN domain [Methanolobus vulcani]